MVRTVCVEAREEPFMTLRYMYLPYHTYEQDQAPKNFDKGFHMDIEKFDESSGTGMCSLTLPVESVCGEIQIS
jgi:hypothetical protein